MVEMIRLDIKRGEADAGAVELRDDLGALGREDAVQQVVDLRGVGEGVAHERGFAEAGLVEQRQQRLAVLRRARTQPDAAMIGAMRSAICASRSGRASGGNSGPGRVSGQARAGEIHFAQSGSSAQRGLCGGWLSPDLRG